ncbi:hypothetical protein [Sphingomonas sp.]|uniref:hypothetical protein n=1 Tax=Sphingomonas sp. TaxID=28214 RepID=UPI003FA68D78
MTDPEAMLALTAAVLMGLAIVSATSLRAWHGWLELKRLEIAAVRSETQRSEMPPSPTASTGRIELADLKERVRKLEAIAAGIDLG